MELIRIISNLVTLTMVTVACYCAFDTNKSVNELKEKLDKPAGEVDEVLRRDERDDPRV